MRPTLNIFNNITTDWKTYLMGQITSTSNKNKDD